LLPGLTDELVARGAIPCDPASDGLWFMEGGCLSNAKSGLQCLLVSRQLLEDQSRQRVRALANVQVAERRAVRQLLASADNSRVLGVRTESEEIAADLVIDAAGRGSRTPQWLESLGYAKADEERVEVDIGYTTRLFRREPEAMARFKFSVIPPTPRGKCGGVIIAQPDERWIVTMVGYFGNSAPEELKGFLDYTKALPAPFIHDVICNAEPVGEAECYRYPASVRRHFERLTRFPEGYLVLGDAMCSFNPIYGQGMSVAAAEAVTLRQLLREGRHQIARRFFSEASKIIDNAWGIAVGGDLRIPETVGPRNAFVNFVNWYVARVHKSAHRDPESTLAFIRVAQFVAPPNSIMSPRIARRALFA